MMKSFESLLKGRFEKTLVLRTRIALEPLRERAEAAQAAADAAKPKKKLSARLASFRL